MYERAFRGCDEAGCWHDGAMDEWMVTRGKRLRRMVHGGSVGVLEITLALLLRVDG
ncbi:hypothetical protein M440DRAFT_1401768 [Trichoderma longibrachiatum ATCC 18648]|uniref:Uncharacterized protein n=1 Tax=Trichoderma longibrachiatum ATCC 18648 TaxID=983965 RepID=A0A2T4C429_TRILO|nr:hypothetical protein M440DRAFT_1401768 [Trichoderma longibrachiatum ATCC 18648]